LREWEKKLLFFLATCSETPASKKEKFPLPFFLQKDKCDFSVVSTAVQPLLTPIGIGFELWYGALWNREGGFGFFPMLVFPNTSQGKKSKPPSSFLLR